MRGILLLLLLASSALSASAQSGTNRFIDLNAVHTEFFKRFEESRGFGGARTISTAFIHPSGELTWNGATYSVFPPHLIGLEKQPTAFLPVSGYQAARRDFSDPRLRKQIKTRPLTAFETNAVAQLKAGTNIVTAIEPARILAGGTPKPEQLLVLAPIHAKADCAKCHKCEEGQLLGAFSYAFTRIDPPTNTVKGLAIAAVSGR